MRAPSTTCSRRSPTYHLGVVGGEQDGCPAVGGGEDGIECLDGVRRILLRRRLVDQQDIRPSGKRASDRHPLLLATRQLLDEMLRTVGEADELKRLAGTLSCLRSGKPGGQQSHLDVLGGGEQCDEGIALEDDPDPTSQRGPVVRERAPVAE